MMPVFGMSEYTAPTDMLPYLKVFLFLKFSILRKEMMEKS